MDEIKAVLGYQRRMWEKRNGYFGCNVTRWSIECEVNKHGQARWQGNEISLGEANRGCLDREVSKKQCDRTERNFPHLTFGKARQ